MQNNDAICMTYQNNTLLYIIQTSNNTSTSLKRCELVTYTTLESPPSSLVDN
jgi:hypothetical protein